MRARIERIARNDFARKTFGAIQVAQPRQHHRRVGEWWRLHAAHVRFAHQRHAWLPLVALASDDSPDEVGFRQRGIQPLRDDCFLQPIVLHRGRQALVGGRAQVQRDRQCRMHAGIVGALAQQCAKLGFGGFLPLFQRKRLVEQQFLRGEETAQEFRIAALGWRCGQPQFQSK